MKETKLYYTSANKLHKINSVIWEPSKISPKAILQISHGMSEKIQRYKHFANFLSNNGFIVCGNDHSGHGESYKETRGFMGKSNGDINMVEDMRKLHLHMKKKFPRLPYFLLGHSMGSFLSRMYCYYYGNELSGVVFTGTKGSEKLLGLAIAIADGFINMGGGMSRAEILNKMTTKRYNNNFKPNYSEYDWLSRNPKVGIEFQNSDDCGFMFTFYGYRDIFNMLNFISDNEWYKNYPKKLPTLLVSGSDDPVGDFSKGVYEVFYRLKRAGVENISVKIYDNGRHEILNEINRLEVYSYILNFLNME